MNGLAALAIVAGFSSCVKDVDGLTPAQEAEKAKDNAEQMLGVAIPEGQTWEMASQVTANVTVNGDFGANYVVNIYENNPFANATATLLGRASVANGKTATISFTSPAKLTSAYVAVKDEKGYSYVKGASISNGKLESTFSFPGNVSSARRAMRSSAADNFTIPTYSQPSVNQYLEGAVEIDDQNCAGDIWDGPTCYSYKTLKMSSDWNKKIAALGNTNSDQGNFARTLYIEEDATWTVTSDQPTLGQGTVIVVAGEINIPSGVTLNTSGDPTHNCQIIVLRSGKITGKGKLSFNNGSLTGAYDYIGGTVDVGTINNNGGEVYIAGSMKADVLEGGAGRSVYINAGKVEIGNSVYGSSSANMRVLNNCWWEVKGDISCRNIVQGAGAYFHAKSLAMSCAEDGTGDIAYIYAKGNSLIDITNAASFNNVDIVGPTGDDYAFIQLGSVGMSTCAMNYTGGWGNSVTVGAIQNNIYLSVDTPETDTNMYNWTAYESLVGLLNGDFSTSDNPYAASPQVGNGNAQLIKKGEVGFTTKDADECSPGVVVRPPTPVLEKPKVYTYAFEDNMLKGDYDMNDVVLRVSFPYSANDEGVITAIDSTHLKVTLVAAGATFKIKVKMGEQYIFGGREVHDLLGHPDSYLTINTGSRPGGSYTGDPYTETVNIPSGWDYDFNNLDVRIDVTNHSNQNYDVKFVDQKEAPWAIMISGEWEFPTELTNVEVAYPGTSDNPLEGKEYYENSFKAWAATLQRSEKMKSWSDFPAEGKTIKTINQ